MFKLKVYGHGLGLRLKIKLKDNFQGYVLILN
jgi:hypothetical protein